VLGNRFGESIISTVQAVVPTPIVSFSLGYIERGERRLKMYREHLGTNCVPRAVWNLFSPLS
jgi:hypothetical protein